jgi:hypothetical protein
MAGRWKKGESGNPSGPKPGFTHKPTMLRDLIQNLMEEETRVEVTEGGKKRFVNMNRAKALTIATYNFAMRGDGSARNFLADRWLGRAVQPVNFQGGGGEGIKIIFDGHIETAQVGGNGDGDGAGPDAIRILGDNDKSVGGNGGHA